jgi:hypothetical protein
VKSASAEIIRFFRLALFCQLGPALRATRVGGEDPANLLKSLLLSR